MNQNNSSKNPGINKTSISNEVKKQVKPANNNEKNSEKINEKNKVIKKQINNIIKSKKIITKKQSLKVDDKLANLTTFQKIIKLQQDLKIISSIKQQFEGNRKNMIEKIKEGCQKFFTNKITMKKIFDYCSNIDPEKVYEYNLLTDEQTKNLLNNYYNNLFEFFFVLRNDNNLMLNLIENFNKENYENISDFLVNFYYEDIINIFNQEEILILIYLLLEKYIIRTNQNSDINNNNSLYEDCYSSIIKKTILYPIFTSLTRKPDIRNFLKNILSELILSIEKNEIIFAVDIGHILKVLKDKNEEKNFNKFQLRNRLKTLKNIENTHYLLRLSNSLKDNKKKEIMKSVKIEHKSTLNDMTKEIGDNNKVNHENIQKNNDINLKKDNHIGINSGINKDINLDKVDPLLIKTDITREYLEKKLKDYEGFETNDLDELNSNIIKSMKEYLNYHINNIKQSDFEKYSNFVFINSINAQSNNTSNEQGININIILDYFKSSYQNITEIISDFLNKLKKNINSIPFIIKSILNIIDILLDYKYNHKISLFQKFIFKANFFIGNIILPILENPFYNGIITDKIISKNTLINCKMIASILNVLLSGQLFFAGGEPCKAIFNNFFIEIMPEILEIIQMIEMDLNLPEKITDLITSIEHMNDINRKINYNYFYENEEEKFQIQSICFSYSNAINIINALKKLNKKISFYENEDKRKKEIIEFILKNADVYESIFNKELSQSKKEFEGYIYIIKINYLPSLESKMNSILKDNFISDYPPGKEKFKKEEFFRFKRCLSKVLTYSNLIHKEDMSAFTEINSNKYIYDLNLIETLFKKNEKKLYDEIMNNKKSISNINKEKATDPDFKNEILPAILVKIKEELGANTIDENNQRILYCCSYIQLHIDFIPKKYSKDNYNNLCIELIKDTEDNVNVLRNNILNQFKEKIKDNEKTILIISKPCSEITNMEKLSYIKYLYNQIKLPYKFHINYTLSKPRTILSIDFKEDVNESDLNKLEKIFYDFNKIENIDDDLISFEEKIGLNKALDTFFQNVKIKAKEENILNRYSLKEIETVQNILSNLVDYVHSKLYQKIFPKNKSKMDQKFYKKCSRLQFIKPENLLKNKNIIDESLCKECYKYIKDIDKEITPLGKIKSFGKANSILQNSIKFNSGSEELGIDDTTQPLIYVMIKAKPENIYSNYNYCRIFLDKDLSKQKEASLLTQMGMIIEIIKDMNHEKLIGVTKEQFGVDEE